MPKIKICGLFREQDIEFANEAKAEGRKGGIRELASLLRQGYSVDEAEKKLGCVKD